MPLYEYRCRDCGGVTEVLVRSTDRSLDLACHHCRSRDLEKIVSSPGAVRMGSSLLKGKTCCGQEERCASPPCSAGGAYQRD